MALLLLDLVREALLHLLVNDLGNSVQLHRRFVLARLVLFLAITANAFALILSLRRNVVPFIAR